MRTIKILLTLGPASTPVDEVRRITNHSTGTLGTTLGNYFLRQGHSLVALRGTGATTPTPFPYESFTTNADLLQKLIPYSQQEPPDLILHAAALSDYEIERIEIPGSHPEKSPVAKISSHHPHLQLHLKPAKKILPELPLLFPQSIIVGWKYELHGTEQEAIQKSIRQVTENKIHYSVINGKAYGEGYGICDSQTILHSHLTPEALSEKILQLQ